MKTKELFKEITMLFIAAGYEVALETKGKQKIVGKDDTLTIESDSVVLRGYPKEVSEE